MAKKKADQKPKDKVEEVKEVIEIEEPKTEEKSDTVAQEKSEAVAQEKDEEKSDTVSPDDKKVEDEPKKEEGEVEDKPEGEDKKEDKEDKEPETEDKGEEKSKEKKSLKEKILAKKENDDKKEVVADENKDGYVSAREVVNTLDKDVKIIEKSEDEILANHVAEQLRENQDYFIFRIRKSIALMLVGLTILLLWMIPLVPYLKTKLGKTQKTSDTAEQIIVSTSSVVPAVKESELQRIRIKIDSESGKSASISSLLKNGGYSEVDILEAEVEEDGINVAVKKGGDELREKLMLILKDEYNAGSSSSELTDDSDFSAVILIGK